MKISPALSSVRRLYIETAPFIYYVEDHQVYGDLMENIFDVVERESIEVSTSVITLAEALTKPLKSGDKKVEHAYRTLLQQTQQISLATITVSMAERSADLRGRYNLRTPDALHLAAALETRCDSFLTNDLGLRRVKELTILVLDELQLDT